MNKKLLKAEENNFSDFLFYDIEVFAEDCLVVFKDIDGITQRIFHNSFNGLREFIQGKILVAYNNYHYDDFILTAMLDKANSPYQIKYINDCLIQQDLRWNRVDGDIFSLDCFQQINVARSSLKKIEGNIGLSIDESKVDFDINRRLTDSELEDTIKYCEQDVNATIAIFKLRWYSYFIPKLMIVDMLPVEYQRRALRWNTTTITAFLLTGNEPVSRWLYYKLGENSEDNEIMYSVVPEEAVEMWTGDKEVTKYKHHDLDCIIEFSMGGLHGVCDTGERKFKNVKLLDVTSLYPNILIKIGALGKATEKYQEIVNQRVKVKHKDPVLSNALKLVINSTYGLMKNQYSKLYNPKGAESVCIFGQIALYDLCTRLYEAGYKLININTDGVAFNGGDEGNFDVEHGYDYEEVWHEWEEDYGLNLELSEFDTWIQKDVNNYVARYKNGKLKVKGGEVNHYFDPTDYLSDPLHLSAGVNWSGTNSKGIINKCIVNKLIYDKSFDDTIIENLDNPILFQYILQCGNTYLGTVDDEGNEYQKVNRVFATKNGVTLKKKKKDFNPQFFPNAPESMYIYNGDLRDFSNFRDIIDTDFYVTLARNKYEKLWE